MWLIVMGPLLAGIGLLATGIDWPAVIAAAGKAANSGATTAAEIFGADRGRQPEPRRHARPRRRRTGLGGAGGVPALSGLPGHGAALVGLRPSLRRGRGDVAAAHRQGLRRLSALHRVVDGLFHGRRYRHGHGVRPGRRDARFRRRADQGDRQRRGGHSSATSFSCSVIRPSTRSRRLALWRNIVESLEVAGIAALDQVKAQGQASSAFGEGLADALNVGGL